MNINKICNANRFNKISSETVQTHQKNGSELYKACRVLVIIRNYKYIQHYLVILIFSPSRLVTFVEKGSDGGGKHTKATTGRKRATMRRRQQQPGT